MTEGYMKSVKEAMTIHIAAADSSLSPAATHILSAWENQIWQMNTENLPIVTVRIGPAATIDDIFGRQLGSSLIGTYTQVFFTAHVHETVPSTGDKMDNALETAEKIKTALLKADDPDTSGIVNYERITIRESPIKAHAVARVIIEGYIIVRRPH